MLNKIFREIIRSNSNLNSKLSILTCPTHERQETNMSMTGHDFYSYRCPNVKDWNYVYGYPPSNYMLLPHSDIPVILPLDIDNRIDVVLAQCISNQFRILGEFARRKNLPLIRFEHTMAYPHWNKEALKKQKMVGDLNVFISEFSARSWMFDPADENVEILPHMMDTETFVPNDGIPKNKKILSVVNDWVNRRDVCGFDIWQRVTNGLPVKPVGSTQGLSNPAPSINDLVREYQECSIFINTSRWSPIPTSLLEAMSCGAICISTATGAIPEYIMNEYNGFCTNDENKMRNYLVKVLRNPDDHKIIGERARSTILEKCNKENYINKFNNILEKALNS